MTQLVLKPVHNAAIAGNNASYATARSTGTSFLGDNQSVLDCGQYHAYGAYECEEMFWEYDPWAELPEGAVLDSAALRLKAYDKGGLYTGYVLEARLSPAAMPTTAAGFVPGDDLADLTLLATLDVPTSISTGVYYEMTDVDLLANVPASGKMVIVCNSDRHRTGTVATWERVRWSSKYTAANSPELVLDYHLPPQYAERSFDFSWLVWTTKAWEFAWEVGTHLRTWDAAWEVGTHLKEWDASWRVGVDHAERTWPALWLVLAEPVYVSREWGLAWRVLEESTRSWDVAWLVKETDPGARAFDLAWLVGGRFARAFDFSWLVNRRSHIVVPPGPDPTPVEVIDDVKPFHNFNGLDLNNGTTTHVLGKGGNVGADGVSWDVIRHYDGSRLIHDVQVTEATITIPLQLTFTDGSSLGAFIASLSDACLAGGSYSRQVGESAPVRTYSVLPSSPPVIEEDNRFVLQHVATFDLVLNRWAG